MSVILFNKTAYPDRPLKTLLEKASRRIGVKGNTVVKITSRSTIKISGLATSGKPFMWHLKRDYRNPYEIPRGSGSGWIHLTIPGPRAMTERFWKSDGLRIAESFFRVVLHEFAHVHDIRSGKGLSRKVGRWSSRRSEISAENQKDAALAKPMSLSLQDALLEVGLLFEIRRGK